MKEKDFQTKFNHWLKEVYKKTGCFELKLTKTGRLPFSAVAEHQINALWNAKHKELIFKIPDCGYQNPFDCFSMAGIPAFVVIKYAISKKIYMIDIDDFIKEKESSEEKSLTEERAKQITSLSCDK